MCLEIIFRLVREYFVLYQLVEPVMCLEKIFRSLWYFSRKMDSDGIGKQFARSDTEQLRKALLRFGFR